MRALFACLLLIAASAHAALQPRDINNDGVVDAYFDTAADLTWTADANLPSSQGLGSVFSYPDFDGGVDSWTAYTWAHQLNLFGVTGWRLPRVFNAHCIDAGIDCRDTGSETPDYSGPWRNIPGTTTHTFQLQFYWSESFATADYPGQFLCFMGGGYCTDQTTIPGGAWAVHDGDIAAVPEPSTAWLLVLGFGALIPLARRPEHH